MGLSDKPKGYNPLRWDCEKRGCFNVKRRPKIEVFSDCFPGRINFGDIDGIVEINGFGLMLEWKTGSADLPIGQKIMYERLSKTGILTVFCVNGNAETMEVTSYMIYFKGKKQGPHQCNMTILKDRIKKWVGCAKTKTL